jgi:hypothetical protein
MCTGLWLFLIALVFSSEIEGALNRVGRKDDKEE